MQNFTPEEKKLVEEIIKISEFYKITYTEALVLAMETLRKYKQRQDDKLLKSVLASKEEIRQGKGMSPEEVMTKLKESRKQ